MPSSQTGVIAIVAACTIWGLSPIYYKLLLHVPASELFVHRMLWSMVTFVILLTVTGKLGRLSALLRSDQIRSVGFAALMVSANWFLFIFSVQAGRTTETSLGYYIFPLVAILLGYVFFQERLNRAQQLAVLLAVAAVFLLIFGAGLFPWISLILAVTFGLYSLIKKRMTADPIVSVTAETVILAPFAVIWLAVLHLGGGGVMGSDLKTDALLIFSGTITAVPLVMFSYASQRVSLTTIGLVGYVNPTLQFFCAVVLFREPFGPVHAVSFALIWTALAIYSTTAFRQERARRSTSRAAAASGTD